MELGDALSMHPDLLNAIILHLGYKSKCVLALVNKFCSKYINSLESHYSEIIHDCPWLSAPRRIDLRCPEDGEDYYQGAFVHNYEKVYWMLGDNCIIISVSFRHVRRTYTVPMYPDLEEFTSKHFDDDEMFQDKRDWSFEPMGWRKENELVRHHIIRTPASNEIARIEDYNDSVAMTVTTSASYYHDTMGVSFFTKEDYRPLRRIANVARFFPPVLHRPGELWIMDTNTGCIMYYGPRADKFLNPDLGGRLYQAYFLAECGKAKEAIEKLRGYPIDTRFDCGDTALMAFLHGPSPTHLNPRTACLDERLDLFLAAGADINANSGRETSLSWLIRNGAAHEVRSVLAHGATVHDSAVEDAIERHDPWTAREIIPILVEYGAKLNEKDIVGQTPLMYATSRMHNNTIELLLQLGADPTIRDPDGLTALDIARQRDVPGTEIAKYAVWLLEKQLK